MSGIQVIVHRDSVCMGDDVDAPHEKRFWLGDEAEVSEIFRELASSGYLPSIAGFNERWKVEVNGRVVCGFGKNIENPEFLLSPQTKISSIGSFAGEANVRLVYFSASNGKT